MPARHLVVQFLEGIDATAVLAQHFAGLADMAEIWRALVWWVVCSIAIVSCKRRSSAQSQLLPRFAYDLP